MANTNDYSSQLITCFGYDIANDDLEALDELITALEQIPSAKILLEAYRIECQEQIEYDRQNAID